MSDSAHNPPSLSELSHLFLSSVRERTTADSPRPVRKPPTYVPAASTPDDLSPEELASVAMAAQGSAPMPAKSGHRVAAVLASHLDLRQADRVRDYARHLARGGVRVGLIQIDTAEFAIHCYDCAGGHRSDPFDATADHFDARKVRQSLDELDYDIDRWLLVVTNPRTPEARQLLRSTPHWVLLSDSDHDGVIASYRSLKGLADIAPVSLSLALCDDTDEASANRVHARLDSVSQQFLGRALEFQGVIRPVIGVAQHTVVDCRMNRDKAQTSAAAHWSTAGTFLAHVATGHAAVPAAPAASVQPAPAPEPVQAPTAPVTFHDDYHTTHAAPSAPSEVLSMKLPAPAATHADFTDIIELPAGAGPEALLSLATSQLLPGSVATPIKPPMCPSACVAVTREGKLALIAATSRGLSELRHVAAAYRWLKENRQLIAMALPQFSHDASSTPHLLVLVDRADSAEPLMEPLQQSPHVTLAAYQKVRLAGHVGVMLSAA